MSSPAAGHDSTNQANQHKQYRRKRKEIWGDRISKKSHKLIRLSFQNIRGFGTMKNSVESKSIREFINQNNRYIYDG
jgi:hypothetical protein